MAGHVPRKWFTFPVRDLDNQSLPRYIFKPKRLWWCESVSPNWHFTSTMAANCRISSVNYFVHRIVRKHAVIVLGENRQISRACLQLFTDWSVAFCVDAVACRTTGLIFRFAYIDILSRCARVKSDDRIDNYQPLELSRFHNAISSRLYSKFIIKVIWRSALIWINYEPDRAKLRLPHLTQNSLRPPNFPWRAACYRVLRSRRTDREFDYLGV